MHTYYEQDVPSVPVRAEPLGIVPVRVGAHGGSVAEKHRAARRGTTIENTQGIGRTMAVVEARPSRRRGRRRAPGFTGRSVNCSLKRCPTGTIGIWHPTWHFCYCGSPL